MKRRLGDFGALTPAEQKIRDQVCSGNPVIIGDDVPEQDAGDDRRVRAEFLRYIILGGCTDLPGHPLTEKGVDISGARVTGALDLTGARISHDVGLFNCFFNDTIILLNAKVETFALNHSMLKAGETGRALFADGLQATGYVFLQNITAQGAVRLPGATLGGDLACEGATFTAGETGDALFADGLRTTGDVILSNVTAQGAVRLVGATLGIGLDCDGATFTAGETGGALSLERADIKGVFFLRNGSKVEGKLNLMAANISTMVDDPACWPARGNLMLDRCRYDAFLGIAPVVDAASRIRWLDLQNHPERDFWPQPWEQCAKVLREMGHAEDARRVLIAKEERQRRARRLRYVHQGRRGKALVIGVSADILWLTVAYGRRPLRAFVWLLGLWILGALVFHTAAHNDAIKPNNAFVLRSPEWAALPHAMTLRSPHRSFPVSWRSPRRDHTPRSTRGSIPPIRCCPLWPWKCRNTGSPTNMRGHGARLRACTCGYRLPWGGRCHYWPLRDFPAWSNKTAPDPPAPPCRHVAPAH